MSCQPDVQFKTFNLANQKPGQSRPGDARAKIPPGKYRKRESNCRSYLSIVQVRTREKKLPKDIKIQ